MTAKSAARRVLYAAEKSLQAMRFAAVPAPADDWPVLLGISFPKSGTHLLDQILLGFSRVAPFSKRLHSFYAEYEGESGRSRPVARALAWLDSLRPADVASAHLFARPQAVSRVAQPAFLPFFIFRDPRDVVVSHVFYVTEMQKRHVHHEFYASLPDFDSRLRVSILGRPELDIEFPNIAQRFEPYLSWLDCPQVLQIHFEDLVNEKARTLTSIVDAFLTRAPIPTPRHLILRALEQSISPQRSPTFRSGRTGEWKRYFKPEHKALFQGVAGDLLDRLGYVPGSDW